MRDLFHCVHNLEARGLFQDAGHKNRFIELVDCYQEYPFYNAGLCKCMFLGSWDQEHFFQLLDILSMLTLEGETNTKEMEDNGVMMEHSAEGHDLHLLQLSGAFLQGKPYVPSDTPIDEEGAFILEQCLKAAEIIENYF